MQGALSGRPPFEECKLFPLWCELMWAYFCIPLGRTLLSSSLVLCAYSMGEIIPHSLYCGPGVCYHWAKYHQLLLLADREEKVDWKERKEGQGCRGKRPVWGQRVLSESETRLSGSSTGVLGSSFQGRELLSLWQHVCVPLKIIRQDRLLRGTSLKGSRTSSWALYFLLKNIFFMVRSIRMVWWFLWSDILLWQWNTI